MKLPDGTICAPEVNVATVWGDWLHGFAWGWWCHLTFLTPPSHERAEAMFKSWVHGLNNKLYGRSFYKYHLGARWVRGTEWQRRGAIHYHVLIAETDRLNIDTAVKRWNLKANGDAKIAVYDSSLGATKYLTKVYSELPTGEIHLGGRWTGKAAGLVGKVV